MTEKENKQNMDITDDESFAIKPEDMQNTRNGETSTDNNPLRNFFNQEIKPKLGFQQEQQEQNNSQASANARNYVNVIKNRKKREDTEKQRYFNDYVQKIINEEDSPELIELYNDIATFNNSTKTGIKNKLVNNIAEKVKESIDNEILLSNQSEYSRLAIQANEKDQSEDKNLMDLREAMKKFHRDIEFSKKSFIQKITHILRQVFGFFLPTTKINIDHSISVNSQHATRIINQKLQENIPEQQKAGENSIKH